MKGKMRKVGFLQGQLHDQRDAMNAYVVYKDDKVVAAALSLNGHEFQGKHLRVDAADKSKVSIDRTIARMHARTRERVEGLLGSHRYV